VYLLQTILMFGLKVKYRGMEPVLAFRPSQAQPRPGLIEVSQALISLWQRDHDALVASQANQCVKRLMARPKISRIAVISCSPDGTSLICVEFVLLAC
jgi:hypothetical protein